MNNVDIIILSIPKLILKGPILSLGQLKAALESSGYSSWMGDFNMWLYKQTVDTELAHIWDTLDTTLTDRTQLFHHEEKFSALVEQYIVEYILPRNPKVVGFTAFSAWTFPFIELFTTVLRRHHSGRILLGGPALTSKQAQNVEYVDKLVKCGLVDDFISGDADIALQRYMAGERDYPGINNYEFDNSYDRNELPFVNYDDFDMSDYHNPQLLISGSRGCVRKCAFCNVPLLWDKFISKDGDRIADEIIHLHERYGVSNFRFSDSLVNGNQKSFRAMMERLSDYLANNDADIFWQGQFIIRETRFLTDDLFDLMRSSGCGTLQIGIESGSEKIRRDIKKPFSNAAIEYHLQQFQRIGLKVTMLMFVGFPTENEDDFKESLDILDMFAKYDCVNDVGGEHPMLVIPGTPVHINQDHYGIHDYTDYFKWTSAENDYITRIERFFRFINKAHINGLYERQLTSISNIFIDEYMEQDQQNPEVLEIISRLFGREK